MNDDLIAWLRAQLDEDERGVRAAFSSQYDWEEGWGAEPSNGAFVITPHVGIIHEEVQAAHIERWNPARVLAEVEAKRRILEGEQSWTVATPLNFQTSFGGGYVHIEEYDLDLTVAEFQERFCVPTPPSKIVRLLALPYADRPGYREDWRP